MWPGQVKCLFLTTSTTSSTSQVGSLVRARITTVTMNNLKWIQMTTNDRRWTSKLEASLGIYHMMESYITYLSVNEDDNWGKRSGTSEEIYIWRFKLARGPRGPRRAQGFDRLQDNQDWWWLFSSWNTSWSRSNPSLNNQSSSPWKQTKNITRKFKHDSLTLSSPLVARGIVWISTRTEIFPD